jgi:hypothetical protein
LITEFSNLIDMSDLEARDDQQVQQAQLSRSLAAMAVRRLTGCDSETAARSVIDGRDDQGIDAIAFADSGSEVFLVQAKWSARGTAGIDMNAARALVDGFRKLDNRQFDRFNDRIRPLVDKVEYLLNRPQVSVMLVLAVMGEGRLSKEVVSVFEDAGTEFNSFGRRLGHRVINGAEFWRFVREGMAEPPIELVVPMRQWLHRDQPSEAYQGTVSADDVAGWYAEFGERLFERNVRRSLGLTLVNQGMVDTLVSSPETFWSRNNGITMLCTQVSAEFWGSRKTTDPVKLRLNDASVVNGAQTVSAVHTAWEKTPDVVGQADVSVRVICVPDRADGLGLEITRSTNTQNHMERRDFIALDPAQTIIRDDFRLGLDKSYVFKRGELDPAPEDGCSVVHAALALACAHHNPDLVVRAKRDASLLWEQGDGGAYTLLFGNEPSALQIWRSVLMFRRISSALHRMGHDLDGRPAAVIEHGDLIVAHLVFQVLGLADIDDTDVNWEEVLDRAEGETERMARWLVHQLDVLFGPTSFISSTLANPDRCRQLVMTVLRNVRDGAPDPQVALAPEAASRPPRSRATSAVHVLVDAGRIEEGAMLTYVPSNDRERQAMAEWLAADERRRRATWVPERRKPLLWAADGNRYSPSGLVMHMWQLAGWDDSPVAIQGPRCWHLGREGSLVDLAQKIRRSMDNDG